MNPAPVVFAGVAKAFRGQRALQDASLRLEHGELLGLVGPNGAGKSTLLRILVGLYRRDAGKAQVFGLDPELQPLQVRKRCSYLPGETSVYQQMRGREFLEFAQSFHPRKDPARERRLQELFGLPLDRPVRSYSAGMKQKLAILAALSVDADLYVLDEPDRALDASMRLELRAVLLDLRGRGSSLLLCSHHLEELQATATRLLFLRAGAMVSADEVEAAHRRLAGRFSLRLAPGTVLPPQLRLRQLLPDGACLVESDLPPQQALAALPQGAVVAATFGEARLEELYELLYLGEGQLAGGRPQGRGAEGAP